MFDPSGDFYAAAAQVISIVLLVLVFQVRLVDRMPSAAQASALAESRAWIRKLGGKG